MAIRPVLKMGHPLLRQVAQPVTGFGTPELRTLLNESGLGNHPEVIRMMYRAGKAISEDRFVAPSAGGPTGSKDFAKSLYPNQQP
jgi:hypothetical protein